MKIPIRFKWPVNREHTYFPFKFFVNAVEWDEPLEFIEISLIAASKIQFEKFIGPTPAKQAVNDCKMIDSRGRTRAVEGCINAGDWLRVDFCNLRDPDLALLEECTLVGELEFAGPGEPEPKPFRLLPEI